MFSYIFDDKDIQKVKDILDRYEFLYAIHGNEVFADQNLERVLDEEGISYKSRI